MPQNPHVLLTFEELHNPLRHNPLRLPRETTSEPPKVARTCSALYILTWKCALRHNGVHFFDIATSKSGPTMVCFVHFDFKMCFAPQRCALSRHRNFQKWTCGVFYILTSKCASRHNRVHFFDIATSKSGANMVVFCTFWLQNVLRATTACTFSTSQLPKLLRTPQFLTHFTSKCASRHNAVRFFNISTSKTAPNPLVLSF